MSDHRMQALAGESEIVQQLRDLALHCPVCYPALQACTVMQGRKQEGEQMVGKEGEPSEVSAVVNCSRVPLPTPSPHGLPAAPQSIF